jgi:hypothetical protein
MRKTKKLLAVILAVSMIAVLFTAVPTSAAELTDPQKLAAMNLFRGDTAEGLTATYLAKAPDRKTAARLLLRFTGLEEAADAYTGTATFPDATSATVYWQPMIGYLKANPGAGFGGYEDGTFRPNDPMTAQAFYKVLLTILGYKQDTDFTWAQTITFAASKGLSKVAGKTTLTNADAAVAMVEALNANTKSGEKLINALINDEIVTPTQAAAAGFTVITSITGYEAQYTMGYGGANPLPATVTAVYKDGTTASVAVAWSAFSTTVEGTYDVTGTIEGYGTIKTKVTLTKTLTVTDAYPSGTREITVMFNMPVPTSAAVTCKFGVSVLQGLTQTWSTDRRTLKISRTYNFTPGTYSVTVLNSTKEFTIENEKLTQVEIGAINLYPQPGAQDLDVTFYNQYGLPMNPFTMTLQLSAFSPQKPAEVFTMNKTATSVTISGVENLVVNDTVNLFVVDNNTAQAATKTVTVVAAPTISAFSFGELTIAGSATRILTGTSGHLISVNAYDQYGNSYKLRTGNQDISTVVAPTIPLLLISSDNSVVDATQIEVNADGKLFFKPGAVSGTKGGTVTLTVMSTMGSSAVNTSFTVTVYEPAKIATLQIQGVSSTMYAGQWAPMVVYAYDQYGNFLALENINTPANLAKLKIVSSLPAVIPSGNAGSATGIRYNNTTKLLEIFGASSGTTTIMISYDGKYQASMSVTVQAAAASSQLTGVTLPAVFQKTAHANLDLDSFALFDQYGAPIGLTPEYTIEVVSTAGLTISNPAITTMSPTCKITAPDEAKNYDLVFTLKDNLGNALSSQSMNIQVVDATGVSSYQFEQIGTMYSKAPGDANYHKLINITGRTLTGISVQLVYDAVTGLPVGVQNVTSSNAAFTTEVKGDGRLYLKANYDGSSSSVSTTLKAWSTGGTELASTTVTATKTAPYMQNVYFIDTTKTLSIAGGAVQNFANFLAAKDQYGVPFDLTGIEVYYMTTNAEVISVDNTTDTFTLLKAGTCTVKAYYPKYDRTLEMVVNVTE